MKVYYVSNRYDGCWYLRCYLPMLHNGWDGDKTSPYRDRVTPEQRAKGVMDADVVVFQRPDQPEHLKLGRILKAMGKTIVFDNDDTYKPNSGLPTTMESLNGLNTLLEMNKNLEEFIHNADVVTTTTDFLAEEYRKLNSNVVVLPNMVDPDDWDEPLRNETDIVRIGMVGSVASNSDYENVIPVLEHYKDNPNVKFVLMALPADDGKHDIARNAYKKEIEFWNQYNIEWQHFVPQREYIDTLNSLKLDIMLIPRHDSYFNRAKSNVKFLEASMLEIPVIAQGFSDKLSPYEKDKDACKVIYEKDDWLKETSKLIESKKLRREIGKNAKRYTIENYNIHDNYEKWKDAYTLN